MVKNTQPYKKITPLAFAGLFLMSFVLYSFTIKRADFQELLGIYTIAFTGYLILFNQDSHYGFAIGLIARTTLLFTLPILSEDYLRFIWDGWMIHAGVNPFNHTPSEVINQGLLSQERLNFANSLYEEMNSPEYFTLYPPINQWLFWIAASFKNTFIGVTILRLFILLADLGVYLALQKFIHRFKLPKNNIWLYWLNPLIIIEGVGNVHMEILMVCFFLWGLLMLASIKDAKASMFLALAFLSKIYVVFAFPLLYFKNQNFRNKKIFLIAIPIIILAFIPFINLSNIGNMLSSFELYINRFEFNASIFYLVKSIGEYFLGYDIIRIAGPALTILGFIAILALSYAHRYKNRLQINESIQWIFLVFLFCSPIVHPWYLIVPLTLSAITKQKSLIIWSYTIIFSYAAYGKPAFEENPLWLVLEYSPVLIVLIAENTLVGKRYLK